jgi:phage gp36-like protein
MTATIIRHESWVSPASTTTLETAIAAAKIDVLARQTADPTNYHAVDVYDLPRRGLWRVFSLLAVADLGIEEVIDLCCCDTDHNIINGDTSGGGVYCTPVGMLRYGAAELSQRSVNADDVMCNPVVLRDYILGSASNIPEPDAALAPVQYAVIVTALEEASREVDYWIARITTTPLITAVPVVLRDITCRIARYRLARYEEGSEETSRVYRDYKQSVQMLHDLSVGKAELPDLPKPVTDTPVTSSRYAVRAPESIYNYTSEGWR